MRVDQKLYIAGTGMITSVGVNASMTEASIRAGIDRFEVSEYINQLQQSITMAQVPHEIFDEFQVELEIGVAHSELMDREIKMAMIAAAEALEQADVQKPIPLILAMPEEIPYVSHCPTSKLINNLVNKAKLPIDPQQSRSVQTGRAGGIEVLDLARRCLYDLELDYVLVGGSDSYRDYALLNHLNESQRTTAPNVADGFVPGEAAGFMVLSRHPQQALQHEGFITALNSPGLAQEPGHLYSEEPCLGEGLNQAFQQALSAYQGPLVEAIYGSMNGENFWAREYGVACLRNSQTLHEDFTTEHPADCYGDIGAATAPILMTLAEGHLRRQTGMNACLVYSSSDRASRAAVVVEKLEWNSGLSREGP